MSDSKYLKGPFKADFHGGYVFSGPENFMFGQVRGWGDLQYKKDAEATQDAHLQFMVDALNEKANPAPAQAAYMRLARYVGPQSEHRKNEGPLADVVIAELEKAKADLKRAGEEIANLAHPEFGEMGRLQEEIHDLKKEVTHWKQARESAMGAGEIMKSQLDDMKKEVEWLTFYKREVYQCLGSGVDDVNKELRDAYVREKGIDGVPEKLRKEYLDYEADHKED